MGVVVLTGFGVLEVLIAPGGIMPEHPERRNRDPRRIVNTVLIMLIISCKFAGIIRDPNFSWNIQKINYEGYGVITSVAVSVGMISTVGVSLGTGVSVGGMGV